MRRAFRFSYYFFSRVASRQLHTPRESLSVPRDATARFVLRSTFRFSRRFAFFVTRRSSSFRRIHRRVHAARIRRGAGGGRVDVDADVGA